MFLRQEKIYIQIETAGGRDKYLSKENFKHLKTNRNTK